MELVRAINLRGRRITARASCAEIVGRLLAYLFVVDLNALNLTIGNLFIEIFCVCMRSKE